MVMEIAAGRLLNHRHILCVLDVLDGPHAAARGARIQYPSESSSVPSISKIIARMSVSLL